MKELINIDMSTYEDYFVEGGFDFILDDLTIVENWAKLNLMGPQDIAFSYIIKVL